MILTAGVCFGLQNVAKTKEQTRVSAASTKVKIGDDEYSALFGGDVVFSVEKVLVNSEENDSGLPKNLDAKDVTFLGSGQNYDFKNIGNETSTKTVVDNGEFVKLDNVNNNGNISLKNNSGLQEAIMVSFGAYVYSTDGENETVQVVKADNSIYSPVSYLDITLKKDAVVRTIPDIRNIDISIENGGGKYFDFVCLIMQEEDNSNEGFYEFSINYMINNEEYDASFEFYILNEASYRETINPDGKDFGYSSYPTLGWTGGTQFEQTNGNDFVSYNIGVNGIGSAGVSYPTITYDYTKYKLSYTHTANQKVTTYDLGVEFTKTLDRQDASLVYKITSNGKTETKSYALNDYQQEESTNLVTIMLTEPGSYVANYKYLYRGYNASNAPAVSMPTTTIRLAVYGMSAYYSETGFEGAKLQHFEIAQNSGNNVDLVIPNGYEITENIDALKNQKLGFVYTLVESNGNEREGNVVGGENSLINAQLKTSTNVVEGDYDYLISNISNVSNNLAVEEDEKTTFETKLNLILSKINYVETNQGSLWIEGNDKYLEDSFYYYSPTKLNVSSLTCLNDKGTESTDDDVYEKTSKDFTNTTSFNAKGYYLVFIHVSPTGDATATETNFWQIFAMQYTSSSVNINIETIDGEVIAGGKYTNKDTVVYWEKPGVFDRDIEAFYYSYENYNASREELLAQTKKILVTDVREINGVDCFVSEISGVAQGKFVKYLIRLESEGESATHKIFTIDRQEIAGIQPYLIEERNSGNSIYYAYATDKNNYSIPINNSITNGYATISWNDKASGAETFASYSYTPFSQNSNDPVKISGNNDKTWITTNYELGTTIANADLKKSETQFNVDSDCILFNQGIYIIKIWDSAGNEKYYSFIIDKTPNYFEVETNYVSNQSLIFGSNVKYNIGDYKAFKLTTTNETLNSLIEKATSGKLAEFNNYYLGSNNNANALKNLFQKLDDGYYLTVKNTKVVGFKGVQCDNNVSGLNGNLVYSVNGETYYKRTLYAIGENHTYLNLGVKDAIFDNVKNNPYVTVEINKDNARGTVYYSDSTITSIPTDGQETADVKKLDTGSDTNGQQNGMQGAHATSAKNVVFVWNMGSGNFEVSKVTYNYYSLKPNTFNADNNSLYFYGSGESFDLYNNGTWKNNAKSLGDGRAAVQFNGTNTTKEGLYVVTRTYKAESGLGEDVKELKYYFIVDRNGIIDYALRIGENIKLELMEGEVNFDDFTAQNPEVNSFSYYEDSIINQKYNIYLSTTKLPATISVPTGKYFDGTNSSVGYVAGTLDVSVYFNDTNNQLINVAGNKYKGSSQKIYSAYGINEQNKKYFDINIYEYLTNINNELRDRLSLGSTNANWLFLPGDYIIKISDNVVDGVGNNHVQYIGFRITGNKDNGPRVETKTGYEEDNMIKVSVDKTADFKYLATVSQEYLEVVLPKYDETIKTMAQVDPEYVVITQYYNNSTGLDYINHAYTPINGINLKENKDGYVSINDDGTISLWLDTKLRKASGEIDVDNLNTPLYYTVTVRYKLNNGGDEKEKYKNCYVYYDANGNRVDYYQAIYTIRIDREAPSANVNSINGNDSLVNDYNNAFGISDMFENNYHETTANLYFTKQYAKYYQEGKTNKGYIYAYQVGANTAFDTTDVKKVYVAKISSNGNSLQDLATYNLTLPLIDESRYKITSNLGGITSYVGLNLEPNNYYEIIEQDGAGNTTQYVIHYEPAIAEISIPIKILTTSSKTEDVELNLENGLTSYVYNILSNGVTDVANETFFKILIEKKNGNYVETILTDSTTDFETLSQKVVKMLTDQNYGNFEISIITRTRTTTSNINLYDQSSVVPLNIEDLVLKNENNYTIRLDNANKFDVEKNLWYFATNVSVKYSITENGENKTKELIFVGELNSFGEIEYYNLLDENKERVVEIECLPNTTYYLSIKDVLENTTSYRFNTSGQEFVVLSFEEPGNHYIGSEGTQLVHYGYTDATLKYDKTVYSAVIYKKNAQGSFELTNDFVVDKNDTVYDIVNINAIYDEVTGKGGIVEVRVDLYFDGAIETIYNITIDTRLASAALRDSTTGELRDIIKVFNNADYTDETKRPDMSGSGIMNLHWEKPEENNYFDYAYILHELMQDGTYREFELNEVSNYVISTASDSKGVYKFEIKVYGKDGQYLGNRLFSFEVQEVSNQIYYVRNEDGEAVKANSTFRISELLTNYQAKLPSINKNINLPLYVSNQNLEVILTKTNVEKISINVAEVVGAYKFVVYHVYKIDSYDIYFGTLIVDKNEDKPLVNSASISPTLQQIDNITSFTISSAVADQSIAIMATAKPNVENTLWQNNVLKNELLMDVYYNGELIKTENLDKYYKTGSQYLYEIKGNGQYSFVIKDLAGNVHKFANGNTVVDIYVLREVVVLVNGSAPIENAFYNDSVELVVYASTKYKTGTISIDAKRNGQTYVPEGFANYIFSDYGNYRVKITATYFDETASTEILLEKVVTFTILNVKEARKSVDLTSLSGYKISTVINSKGEDKTDVFMEVINSSEGASGMNITYEKIMAYADRLNVSSGKQTFTLTYLVEDEAYPTREVTFSFTLNNENPSIDCSLKKGDSSKKGFTINFNPAIIYEQIGESYVYINDQIVAHITEESANTQQSVKRTFKANGDGDYYIKLVGSSGVVWDSYKVTIKEPLNFWAIIVIVVVVAVVGTVVTTIIILRRKMRIR